MSTLQNFAAPLGRFMLTLMFILSGFNKIGGYSQTQQYMDSVGVPGALLPLVIALEILGGLAVLLGWKAREASLLLAGFCVLSAALFHSNFADQTQMIMFMKNIAIGGGFLMIVANGPGAYALANRQS